MKNYILLLTLLFSNIVFAQKDSMMSKPTSGRYRQGTDGIYIYDDGTFALFGYATLIFGTYKIENNRVNFTPTIPRQAFTILGRENKQIEKGTKLTFEG